MALVHTGFEPSGDNWTLEDERVYQQAPVDTKLIAQYVDGGGPSIFGWDLWGSLSIDSVHQSLSQRCAVYYIGLWHDPPGFLGTGVDNYRAIAITSPC